MKKQRAEEKKRSNVFTAVSSPMRQKILKMLAEEEMHISSIARELKISVPVTSKHIKILEKAELVERKVFGKTHIISLSKNNYNSMFDDFVPVSKIEVKKGTTLMDAFKNAITFEVKEINGRNYIVSSEGEDGYYVYYVNGEMGGKKIEDYEITENTVIEWKRLEPVTKKKLQITVK
ncbi:MAG: ArsR family transcriptional regulator [Methanosarcinaceae archaeon]|nr:ArsR family transcriptional regulator [Methanosarcinaceae archaeon]